jgi:hypothetical protein
LQLRDQWFPRISSTAVEFRKRRATVGTGFEGFLMSVRGLAILTCLVLLGCSPQGTGPTYETGTVTEQRTESARVEPRTAVRESAKLNFLYEIRQADPQYQTIQRAVMNDQDELGIVLSRNVAMDDIPKLMKSLLKRMASEFPGQNLTIVSYAPSDPPMKIGTARLDADTREMTYTAVRR